MVAKKLDTVVWAYVTSLIKDKDRIKNNIRVLREKRENDKSSNKRVMESLVMEKSNLKAKKSKLLELFSDTGMQVEDLKAKINEFDQREKSVDTQIMTIDKELKDIDNFTSIEAEIEKTCELYKNKIVNSDFELKKYIVRKWIEEILIEKDGSIRIKIWVPQGESIPQDRKDIVYNFYPNSNVIEEARVGIRFEEVINAK